MTTAYGVFASLVLGALIWIHFTGWSPMSVRDNPGSSRSSYGGRSYTGAK